MIIGHLIDLAEAKTAQAKRRADKVSLAASKISDLDEEATPESLMLLTMTEEGAKDRSDREVVVPWLKFLWEIYRAVLELLHKNVKLDRLYHKVCEKSFRFCQDYSRVAEFRRLCDMLRTHFNNLQKMAASTPAPATFTKGKVGGWEWTPESIELYLQSRFTQLEIATSMELWNEGFKTVEDIHSIIQLSKRSPKPKLMSIYYEKLTRIFWVSENYLFHAHASYRYFSLCCEYKRDMKAEDRTAQANLVLLATLTIPEEGAGSSATQLIGSAASAVVADEDETVIDKNQQLAVLLDLNVTPTRQALLAEIVASGILNDASPEVVQIYNLLEKSFRPLSLVKDITPLLNAVLANPAQAIYTSVLKEVVAIRAAQQLSKVYSTVKIDFTKNLFAGLGLHFFEVEKILVAAVNRRQLSVKIDHSSNSIRFNAGAAIAPSVDDQLSKLGNNLKSFLSFVEKSSAKLQSSSASDRMAYLGIIAERDAEGYVYPGSSGLDFAERRQLIEFRKEERERVQQGRLRDEDVRKKAEEARRIAEEERRLQEEEELRMRQKLAKLQLQMTVVKTKNAIQALGRQVDEAALNEMNESELKKLLLEAQQEAQRAKEEESRRISEQAKRLDYLTRALRIESAPIIAQRYQELLAKDRADYEARVVALLAEHRENYNAAVIEKARLFARMKTAAKPFEDALLAKQRAAFNKQAEQMRAKALNEVRERRIANARFRKREEEERIEMEQERLREIEAKAESDRLAAEQHEKMRKLREQEEQEALEREHQRAAAEEERRKARAAAAASAEESAPRAPRRDPFEGRERRGEPPAEEPSSWRRTGAPAPRDAPRERDGPRDREPPREEEGRWAREGPRDRGDRGGDRERGDRGDFGRNRTRDAPREEPSGQWGRTSGAPSRGPPEPRNNRW